MNYLTVKLAHVIITSYCQCFGLAFVIFYILKLYVMILIVQASKSGAQVTFKGTLGEFNNFWQHCTNYNMSI